MPSRFYLHVLATQKKMRDWYFTQGRDAHLCILAFLSACPFCIQLETKDWKLLRDEMRTCAFSLSIFMSFFYTTINERLVVAQGRVPLAYVAHTGTRCTPVPIRFYLHVVATQNKQTMRDCIYSGTRCAPVPSRFSICMSFLYTTRNERLEVTQGRDAHLCLFAFYLHVALIHNYK